MTTIRGVLAAGDQGPLGHVVYEAETFVLELPVWQNEDRLRLGEARRFDRVNGTLISLDNSVGPRERNIIEGARAKVLEVAVAIQEGQELEVDV